MPNNNKSLNTHIAQPCSYDPVSEGRCSCEPEISAKLCHCHTLNNPWSKNSLHAPSRALHEASLVAYIRIGGQDHLSKDEQTNLIAAYCTQHGFRLAQTFVDFGKPSQALRDALQELEKHDGIIAVDLNSFVEHQDDRMRDLRPFIHHFFCHPSKHLITIQEGIDTGSAAGQKAAIEFSSQIKEIT